MFTNKYSFLYLIILIFFNYSYCYPVDMPSCVKKYFNDIITGEKDCTNDSMCDNGYWCFTKEIDISKGKCTGKDLNDNILIKLNKCTDDIYGKEVNLYYYTTSNSSPHYIAN